MGGDHTATPECNASTLRAELAFTRRKDAISTPEDGDTLRVRPLTKQEMYSAETYDRKPCDLLDRADAPAFNANLVDNGFAQIDLTGDTQLQATLEGVRSEERLSPEATRAIRKRLSGAAFPLANGGTLRILFIAAEGFFMRSAGPGGVPIPRETSQGDGTEDAAMAVHADQDVDGTPVRQLLKRAGPWLFHHASPTHANRRSPLFLVNVWIPLTQVTRPLTLMDTRSLNRRAHQLRLALPTEDFFDRPEDRRVNDIWSFLHDGAQRWHIDSNMNAGSAYVFETLGTPHGSCQLPGEDRAADRYTRLRRAVEALDAGDLPAAVAICDNARSAGRDVPGPRITASLTRAIHSMDAVLGRAAAVLGGAHGNAAEAHTAWRAEALAASAAVVRKSIEMRCVALVTPGLLRKTRRRLLE